MSAVKKGSSGGMRWPRLMIWCRAVFNTQERKNTFVICQNYMSVPSQTNQVWAFIEVSLRALSLESSKFSPLIFRTFAGRGVKSSIAFYFTQMERICGRSIFSLTWRSLKCLIRVVMVVFAWLLCEVPSSFTKHQDERVTEAINGPTINTGWIISKLNLLSWAYTGLDCKEEILNTTRSQLARQLVALITELSVYCRQ